MIDATPYGNWVILGRRYFGVFFSHMPPLLHFTVTLGAPGCLLMLLGALCHATHNCFVTGGILCGGLG